MELAQFKTPSLWGALLWKDVQQVKLVFAAIVSGFFFIQVVLLLAAYGSQDPNAKSRFMEGTVMLACVAPIILALGCSGMLIGQERQTGTWAWSSSLPVSWGQALGSKLSVAAFGSILVSIPLAIIPLALVLSKQLEANEGTLATIYVSGLTLLVFLEVIIYCFIATLLFREALTALIVAGITLFSMHLIVGALLAQGVMNFLLNSVGGPSVGIAVAGGFNLIVGFVCMALMFEWRWRSGQQTQLSLLAATPSTGLPSKIRYPFSASASPSEWWMMIRHSMANSIWLRASVVVGLVLLLSLTLPYGNADSIVLLAPVAMLLFGISVFEGDQSLSRYRFLADRGVTPWKLAASRLLPFGIVPLGVTVVAIIVLVGTPAFNGNIESLFSFVCICSTIFLVSALSSLCFRKSIIATLVAFMACVLAVSITFAALAAIDTFFSPFGISIVTGKLVWLLPVCMPLVDILLVTAILVLAKRWIVFESPRLAPTYFWIVPLALLLPLFMSCTFGFLSVPLVAWKGTPVGELNERFEDPGLKDSVDEPLLTDSVRAYNYIRNSRGRNLEGVSEVATTVLIEMREELDALRSNPDESLIAILRQKLPKWTESLRTVQAAKSTTQTLNSMIARTSAFAMIAVEEKDPEFSLELWRLNKELQEIANQLAPLSTISSRNVSMYLLHNLSEADEESMGGAAVVQSLIPSIPDERAASVKEVCDEATLDQILLFGDPSTLPKQYRFSNSSSLLKYYPPLRWFAQRDMAKSLARSIEHLQIQQPNFLTIDARNLLLQRFASP